MPRPADPSLVCLRPPTFRRTLAAAVLIVCAQAAWPALIAAAHLGHADVVRQLIAAGAPLDHVNNPQATLKALLDAGASHHLSDREARSPLALARSRGCAAMVRMLDQAGAK